MFTFIAFIVVCLVVQGAVDKLRGKRKPVVRVGGVYTKAGCGCSIANGRVVKACSAHELLRRASN